MSLSDRESSVLFHTYKRLPLEVHHGEGPYLYTTDGRRYLDMFAGLAVNALGYGHPAILEAIREQAGNYIHLSNYFLQEPQVRLAELLSRHAGYPRVFFSNSGAEAIEGTLKLVRKWGTLHSKKQIVSMTNSFHGRTMGALSIMDRPRYREGFGPFLENCTLALFNDPESLKNCIHQETAGVILEFIQGEGGVRPASMEFVRTIEELRRKFGFLLIADEIQSGIGRTGKFFAFEHFGVQPDIVTVAKPIGGGLPLGGILAGEEVAATLEPGMHGTTFGGNPVACAAGTAVIREIAERGLMQHAEEMGKAFLARLHSLADGHPNIIREVRGNGLMIGVELHREAESLVTAMREKGILINGTDGTVLRFLPPLIITLEHIDITVDTLHMLMEREERKEDIADRHVASQQ